MHTESTVITSSWPTQLPMHTNCRFTFPNTIKQHTQAHNGVLHKPIHTQTHTTEDKDTHRHLWNQAKCHFSFICPRLTQTICIAPVCPIAKHVKPLLSMGLPPSSVSLPACCSTAFFSLCLFSNLSLIFPSVAVLLCERLWHPVRSLLCPPILSPSKQHVSGLKCCSPLSFW